ncbi:uncharacterized protein LOC121732564 isoform X2 [Aricia agestis]|uniref:uncharacterized protein LOC121732564 isoform X2 n=1 Tax=Aricia agestis TaxID=91739 RepID=UPI001C2058F2|nr:uncharacterized protein LOC121732564 isoform X2 [Aricia agestis]
MAEEDEIDIVGDFSFNSCFAQNNQGIPSCSDREDTVHPQWLLDSPATNWRNEGPSRKLSGNNSRSKNENFIQTVWSASEKDLLVKEMSIHGRDVDKISKTLKTKSRTEIQALIEAEYGIVLDAPHLGVKAEDIDNVPAVVQEEVIADVGTPVINMTEVIDMVSTGTPTIPVKKTKQNSKDLLMVNPSEILYEDDLAVSTELIIAEDAIKRSNKKERGREEKKMGNHRRKGHANVRWRKQEVKSPKRIRKDSSMSDDSTKNAKMHIVFSSGQALPVSEGEEVIKIEKKKESECESDIEVDIDSDTEQDSPKKTAINNNKEIVTDKRSDKVEAARKFEPMPKRKKKIKVDGGGGYTIMHTEAGDLYEVREEPRRERAPRAVPIQLYPCRVYNAEKPAPFTVQMCVSCLVCADAHAHTSRAEVAGLLGGAWAAPRLRVRTYARLRAHSQRTCCEADPVSQAEAAESIRAGGDAVVGWHHSHPQFRAAPSDTDLRSQQALQDLPAAAPAVAVITSQRWPVGREASVYRCFRVEGTEGGLPVGYSLPVSLAADICRATLPELLRRLRDVLAPPDADPVDIARDVCPLANKTYLEKLISSVSHHMRSAGYADGDPIVEDLIKGIRDIFR